MARKPTKPRYFPSRKGFYCQVDGKQICLAKGDKNDPNVRQAAQEAFYNVIDSMNADKNMDDNKVWVIADHYLAWVKAEKKMTTYGIRKGFIDEFKERHGKDLVGTLKPFHIMEWMTQRPTWGQSTRHMAINIIKGMLNWAEEQGLISNNPLKKVKAPKARSRSKEVVLSAEQRKVLFDAALPAFRMFLVALIETGARPGEIAGVEARHVKQIAPGVYIFDLDDFKTAHHEGAIRHIYLTQTMVDMVLPLMEKYPTGKLFRNSKGTPWTKSAWGEALTTLKQKTGIDTPVMAYGLRHSYITDWILSGKSASQLASFVGNSVNMIEKHYKHLSTNPYAMQQHIQDFAEKRQALEEKPAVSMPSETTAVKDEPQAMRPAASASDSAATSPPTPLPSAAEDRLPLDEEQFRFSD